MPENKTSDEQEFFVRIDNPNVFRKDLLEASKTTLTILKQIYQVNQLRETKLELATWVTKEIQELKILVQKISELIPQHSKEDLVRMFPGIDLKKKKPKKPEIKPPRKPEQRPPAEKQERPPEKPAEPPKPKELTELEKVTRALDEVQKKLQSL